eukprot:1153119-Pelagomonas_calceolata.AAC.22
MLALWLAFRPRGPACTFNINLQGLGSPTETLLSKILTHTRAHTHTHTHTIARPCKHPCAQVEELLSPAALAKFADIRRRLVNSVSPLWLDMHALKMRMRAAACQAFVHGMAGVTEHVRVGQILCFCAQYG